MTTKTEVHPHRKPAVHKEPGGVKSGGDEGASGDGRHLGREYRHGQVS